MSPTLSVMFFQLCCRKRVSTQPRIGNLLNNTQHDGYDDGGLEGLPEHDEENWNGEHVRHDCFEDVARKNDDVREGEFLGKGGQRGKVVTWENSRGLGSITSPA